MASTTIHNFPSDGNRVARGTSTVADNGTIVTGLVQVDGFLVNNANADTVVTMASQSAGTATVNVYAGGVASVGTKTFYWKAWENKKV